MSVFSKATVQWADASRSPVSCKVIATSPCSSRLPRRGSTKPLGEIWATVVQSSRTVVRRTACPSCSDRCSERIPATALVSDAAAREAAGGAVRGIGQGDLHADLLILILCLDRPANLDDQDRAPRVAVGLSSNPHARVEHGGIDRCVRSHAVRRCRSMGVPPMIQDHGQDARATDGLVGTLRTHRRRADPALRITETTSVRMTRIPWSAPDAQCAGSETRKRLLVRVHNYWTFNDCNSSIFCVTLLPATVPSLSRDKSSSRSRPDSMSSNRQCMRWFES